MVTSSEALDLVLRRVQGQGWAGADPYDALLSPPGRALIPLGPAARMAFTQAGLRWPAFRAAIRPPATVNPKGLALFLGAILRGWSTLGPERAAALGTELRELLESLAVRDGKFTAWGYPFPWQSRFLWAPAGTPNAVVTATVGWHLLDWADHARALGADDPRARELASGAALFLSEKLHYSAVGVKGSAVSYTSRDTSRIVNVSMLVARLLARVSRAPGTVKAWRMRDQTTRLLQFTVAEQRQDGTWAYARERRGAWVDSFHTGFVLEALLGLREWGWTVPDEVIMRGFESYDRFFDPDGGARLYREGSVLDAHSAAQGIVTYAARATGARVPEALRAAARAMALQIARWSLERLWIPERDGFAYRVRNGKRDERDYTRWVQSWMALGMGAALELERISELQSA